MRPRSARLRVQGKRLGAGPLAGLLASIAELKTSAQSASRAPKYELRPEVLGEFDPE